MYKQTILTFIFTISLINVIQTRENFVIKSFLEMKDITAFKRNLKTILAKHFKYSLISSETIPELFNELMSFKLHNIKTTYDATFEDKSIEDFNNAVAKKITQIMIKNKTAWQTDDEIDEKFNNEIVIEFEQLFQEVFAFEFKKRGTKVQQLTKNQITDAVNKARTGDIRFFIDEDQVEEYVDKIDSIKNKMYSVTLPEEISSLNFVSERVQDYFNDIEAIFTNPDQIILEWLDKIIIYTTSHPKPWEMIDKIILLLQTLISRDSKDKNANGVDRACKFFSERIFSQETSLGGIYLPIVNDFFQVLAYRNALNEKQTVLKMVINQILNGQVKKNKKITKIVDHLYKLYKISSFLNNDRLSGNTIDLVQTATLNYLRNMTDLSVITDEDYKFICFKIEFLLGTSPKRVYLIDEFTNLFDYTEDELNNHALVYASLYFSLIHFSSDLRTVTSSDKSLIVLYMEHVLTRQILMPRADERLTLSDNMEKYGYFLILWSLFHNLKDLVNFNIQFVSGDSLSEVPLELLKSRYSLYLNDYQRNYGTPGTKFTLSSLKGKEIKSEYIAKMFLLKQNNNQGLLV